MKLIDEKERHRALTSLDENLLVEAAAGTGKTALLAGRITMLLAAGRQPGHIAAITFTELAAGELSVRVTRMVTSLLAGQIPRELKIALPEPLSDGQMQNLALAASHLDELTVSTIHGFCQEAIRSYAIETKLDPGSRVIDAAGADDLFEGVLSEWLIESLSAHADADSPLAVLSKSDPLKLTELIKELAEVKRRHSGATTPDPGLNRRLDIDFCQAVDDFERWYATTSGDRGTADFLADFRTLATFYTDCLATMPPFAELWRLAHPPRLNAMKKRNADFKSYQRLTAWKRNCGDAVGTESNSIAESHFATVDQAYRTLLGALASGIVADLSAALDEVLARYAQRKRAAAVLDFDDLLLCAHKLVSDHEPVRVALGTRYRHIFVDEFQDTDRVQAAIIFLIAAGARPLRWQDAQLRTGALFLVGDPKQAIYRFRGADVAAYNDARAAMVRQGDNSVLQVTANFRSQDAILQHVNACFESVLSADGQPGYVKLSSTRTDDAPATLCAAKITVEIAGTDPHNPPSAGEQREAEAAVIARICRRLVGSILIVRDDGSSTPLAPGDIALLAPTGAELWRYERALETARLSVASQAGKTLMLRQETQDILALLRAIADPFDTLAFGALMRGPLIGLTDQELLDIAEDVNRSPDRDVADRGFVITTSVELIRHPLAKTTVGHLQELRKRAPVTTPLILLAEAIERLQVRPVLAARHGNRGARALANLDALLELARPYGIAGLRTFVRKLQDDWERRVQRSEGRIDATEEAIQIVTIHSSKGLEWPVVIPINTGTGFRNSPQFVHRQSDNTLHWVVDGVAPPSLEIARQEETASETLERQRMWYVACTRASDLLILPHLVSAAQKSWSRIVDLTYDLLPEFDLSSLPTATAPPVDTAANQQTLAVFEEEGRRVRESAPLIIWRKPSDHDPDRAAVLEPTTITVEGTFDFTPPLAGGRTRGVLLHKLMEEFLAGELDDGDVLAVERRTRELLNQLVGLEDFAAKLKPDIEEVARTARQTLQFADIAALRSNLVPERAVWSGSQNDGYLAGRADAVAIVDGKIAAVLDWKSDLAPSAQDRAGYRGQLVEYLKATGASRGALVYMTLGEMEWVTQPSQ